MQAVIRLIPGTRDESGNLYGIYFIDIYDDAGNPTNGNNIQVQYRSEQGGVLGDIQTAIIGGISLKIYQGIIQVGDGPQLNYVILGNNTPGDSAPPIVSDLTIVSIQVTQKADNSGNNGKVTINATCSNPISYYIDNVLQVGFQNLTVTAGPHTAKVVDTYSNEVSQDFTVLKLDSIYLYGPDSNIGGIISRWNAAFNPIVFAFQRKDFDVTGISQDDTTLKPKITVNADITGLVAGDYVYLDAGENLSLTSVYKGVYKVLSVIDSANFTIDADYEAPDTITGYCNINRFRPYYKVMTKIKYVDVATQRFITIISTNRPGPDGFTRADFSGLLKSLLNPKGPDQSDYTQVNFRDYDLAASYQISYAEVWEGNTGTFSDYSDPFYVTFAAKQLGQIGGGNLREYVTQSGQLAKWITDFTEPNYSIGFPFDLSFIYSELIAGLNISYTITLLDINRQPLAGGSSNAYLLNEDASFLLNNDGSKFLIARQNLINVPISERIGLNRLLINQDFDPLAYYFNVQLFKDNTALSSGNATLTEQTAPFFIDANLQIKIDGNIIAGGDMVFTGSLIFTMTPGKTYSFEATCGADPIDGPAYIVIEISKNEVVIYRQVIEATAGASLVKSGIVQPESDYVATVTSQQTNDIVPVDIADNNPVVITPQPITEVKTVRIDKGLCQNPVYLRWLGFTGSWNYYRFKYNQVKTLDIQNPVIIKDYVSDWENQQGIERVISKDASEKMQIYADAIDDNDFEGLKSLKSGVMCQILVSNNPIKWQTIVVNSSTFEEGDTINKQNDFSLTFNLPSKNVQYQ